MLYKHWRKMGSLLLLNTTVIHTFWRSKYLDASDKKYCCSCTDKRNILQIYFRILYKNTSWFTVTFDFQKLYRLDPCQNKTKKTWVTLIKAVVLKELYFEWMTVLIFKHKSPLLYDSTIPLLSIYPKEFKAGTWKEICIPVSANFSIIHNTQKVEAT